MKIIYKKEETKKNDLKKITLENLKKMKQDELAVVIFKLIQELL